MATSSFQRVERYSDMHELNAALAAEGAAGWVATSVSFAPKSGYMPSAYVVLYRKLQAPDAFTMKAIERLMTEGDEDEQAYASALMVDRWLENQ